MVWVGKDHTDLLIPIPLPWAGTSSTRQDFPRPHPTWSSTVPGMEHPQ